ncbi:MAG: 23S rRNA (pseudouridine(1915)-N(3))-methyltransferase RlmH, partial [Acidobacteria bacterium]
MAGAIRILTVGRDRAGPFRELADRYLERISPLAPCSRETVAPSRRRTAAERRRDEARKLRERLPRRGVTVALDAEGEPLDSAAFAARLERWRESGKVLFVVGGPDGLDPAFAAACDHRLSLGPMTLPHELAAVVLLEQSYRALARSRG